MDEVSAILSLKKQVMREMEWTNRPSIRTPQWLQFESFCMIGSEESDEIIFRAHYRPKTNVVKGSAIIPVSEACNLSLYLCEHRIFAIDMHPDRVHKNKVGAGRKYYRKLITDKTHVHLWVEDGDGYAEPIDAEINDIEGLFDEFSKRAILYLRGAFLHPMHGKQYTLLE